MLLALRWILYFVLIASGLKLLDVYVLSVYCPTLVPTVCAYIQNTVVGNLEYIFGWLLYRFGIWKKEIPKEVPAGYSTETVGGSFLVICAFTGWFFPY